MPKPKNHEVKIEVRLHPALKQRVRGKALREGVTVSDAIRGMLESWVSTDKGSASSTRPRARTAAR